MNGHRRVVWTEGMLLGPHHFQQMERNLFGEMDFRTGIALPHAWGVRRLQVDMDALANGRFNLLELEAVLSCGTTVRLPAADPLPEGRNLTEVFTADRSRLDVLLALPEERPGTPRCRPTGNGSTEESPFWSESVRIADENSPGSQTEIEVAHQNLRLLVSGDSLDGYRTLKIAQLERSPDGSIVLGPDYAPPSLALAPAGPVPSILRLVLESLTAKSDTLKVQTREVGGKIQYSTSDVMLFWQVHTVNSFIPVFAHYQRFPETHPVELYLALVRLLGALSTFAGDHHPRDIPSYEHESLGNTFRRLESLFRDLIEISEVSRHENIPLERVDEFMMRGSVRDDLLQENYSWFLAISGPMSEDQIRNELPGKVTIGSTHNIEFLVRRALRGVPISYTAIPSSDFPIKSGVVYFRLEAHGETWDTIKESRTIAIYLQGAELKELSFELIATQS